MKAHEKFAFADEAAFLAKAESLGLALPFSDEIKALFEPFILAGRTLSNRLAVHPMEGADADEKGGPSDLTFRRYRRYAEGGCGLIWFEATAVRTDGKSNPRHLALSRKSLSGFKRLVEATRAAGRGRGTAGRSPLLILQLTFSGRFAKPSGAPRPVVAQRNPHLDPPPGSGAYPPLIPDDRLDRLQDDFAGAAHLAAEAGFDGVDLKACHGYLVAELLAARTRAGSRYGGAFANRSRFILETAAKIKTAAPGLLLACRLGVYDAVPFPFGFGVDERDSRRLDLAEPKTLVRGLVGAGFSLVNVSMGIPALGPHYGRPFDKPVSGGLVPDEHPLTGVARLIGAAAEIQKEFPALAVVGTGYSWLRQFFPRIAAGVIRGGQASLIGLGRLSFAYPDFARDLADRGALDPKKVCIACSGCSELFRAGGPAGCIVRDKTVYKRLPAPSRP